MNSSYVIFIVDDRDVPTAFIRMLCLVDRLVMCLNLEISSFAYAGKTTHNDPLFA